MTRSVALYRPLTRTLLALRPRYRRGSLRNARAQEKYSVAGTPVIVTFRDKPKRTAKGIIEEQMFGGPGAMFKVRLTPPMKLGDLAIAMKRNVNALGAEYQRLGFLKVQEPEKTPVMLSGYYGIQTSPTYFVTHMWAPWRFLSIPLNRLKKGMPIEVTTGDPSHVSSIRDYPVRFIKWVTGKSARYGKERAPLVWFPEPMTRADIEGIYHDTLVRPWYFSKHAYFMPFQHYKALYKLGYKLPPARHRRVGGQRVMEFVEPVPLKWIVDHALRPYYHHTKERSGYQKSPVPIWYTLMGYVLFHMAPIRLRSVEAIRPMREDLFYGLVIPAEAAFEGLAP